MIYAENKRRQAVWDNAAAAAFALVYIHKEPRRRLFLLMAILSQALFTLVSSHLVAFSFLSAGHLNAVLELIKYG